ncbi:HNH endonuclease [Methylobacterium sp. C25]|uniref:HNH endonuclease n=1 Tax=Methylobacterium sp. C25 TaxID=2721622 RepID=UPI001F237805|nr:HNH endonuclease [Methylobacterium sp. C25]MCE4223516.1 HNH endonuclease [Methylobacterium sp. C25]
MNAHVSNLRTLVLNADMQPVSWAPLSVWNWQDALVAVLQERVIQVKTYDDVEVHSASESFQVPSVVALKSYHRRKKVAFTRYHLFLRDEFTCQYCGERLPPQELTFDHVNPRSKGGESVWTNIVASCSADNLRKGNRSLDQSGMNLRRKPFEPSPYQLDAIARRLPKAKNELHNTWLDFLYWDSPLES